MTRLLVPFQAAPQIQEAQQDDHKNSKKVERLLKVRYRRQIMNSTKKVADLQSNNISQHKGTQLKFQDLHAQCLIYAQA
jgi:hypothetical protein